jgi:hypothetical protein
MYSRKIQDAFTLVDKLARDTSFSTPVGPVEGRLMLRLDRQCIAALAVAAERKIDQKHGATGQKGANSTPRAAPKSDREGLSNADGRRAAHINLPYLSNAQPSGAAARRRPNSVGARDAERRRRRRAAGRRAPTNKIVISGHNTRRLAHSAPQQRRAPEKVLSAHGAH